MATSQYIFFTLIPCVISALASTIFLLCFIKYEALRIQKPMKLLAIFQLIDLILSLNTIVPHNEFSNSRQICKLKGFTEQLFSTSEVIWISYFSLFVYRKICLNKSHYDSIDINKALVITFGITCPISILFACLDVYGESRYWCWFKHENKILQFTLLEFLGSYIFMFISCGWGLYVTWRVFKKTSGNTTKIDWNIFRLQVYPVIMFFTYIFMFTFRVLEVADANPNKIFGDFSSALINLIGLMNFIFLGFTKEFRSVFFFKVGQVVPLVNSSYSSHSY